MKILTICTKSPFPSNDGGTLASASLLQMLTKLKIQTTCLVMSTHKHPYEETAIPTDLHENIRFHAIPVDTNPSMTGAFRNLLSESSYHFQRFNHEDVSNAVSHFLAEHSFDAIILDGLFATPYLSLIRRMSNAKVILRAHNVEHEIWKRYASQKKNPLKRWFFSLQASRLEHEEREMAREVDAVFTISPLDKDYFNKAAQSTRIYNLPFALDLKKYEFEPWENGKPTVAHIGAMDWMPNREGMEWFLKKVWPLVVKDHPEANFELAGRSMPEEFTNWHQEGVKVVGEVKSASKFIKHHPIFVVPLFSGSGLRIKILEAMALGRAVVATPLAAEAINAADGEEIMLANDEVTFSKAIKNLMMDTKKIKSIGNNARNMVSSRFGLDDLTTRLSGFFKDLGL